jgi:glycosyltransferase involved in cell wall biosynthesis
MRKRIVYVVNVDWFFVSHRLPIAKEALIRGWEVYLVTKNTGRFDELESLGIKCIDIWFDRSGKNPVKELNIIFQLKRIYRKINPDIIHHITLKPSIYGTIAAKGIGVKKIVNAVSGLGYSFIKGRKSISKLVLVNLLKWAFKDMSSNFIFQNPDDKGLYDSLRFLSSDNYCIIKGSGVDEHLFAYHPPVEKGVIHITFLARMLKDKGVFEFVDAANLLRDRYNKKVKFTLVGGIDIENPSYIREEHLRRLCDQSYIEWQGYIKDVRSIYEQSDIVCLPSYREGLPKSLIEAMAIGRPIITTDAIGCRECVIDGLNGYLVPIKDSVILADRIEQLILNEPLRIEMGKNSRLKMINEMSLTHVINETFSFYEK